MSGRTRIKICGLTAREDVELAVRLGADAVGAVLWTGSPRGVSHDAAKVAFSDVPAFVTRVGVFVEPTRADVRAAIDSIGLDAVQLHGRVSVEEFLTLDVRIIAATSPASEDDVRVVAGWPPRVVPLVDAHDPVRHGGTGRHANWQQARALASHRRVILAGGLNSNNVERAIAEVAPFAVDVSSGVEQAPGRKDAERLRAFFEAVRRADRAGADVAVAGEDQQ